MTLTRGWDECATGLPGGQKATVISVGEDYPQRVGGTKASVIGSALFHHSALVQNITAIKRRSGGAVRRSEQPRQRTSRYFSIIEFEQVRWLLFTCQGDRNSYRMGYIQLDVDVTMLMGTLGVGTLGMGGCGLAMPGG